MNSKPYRRDSASASPVGDAPEVLPGMPDGSAGCLVTSPPCWGKRDYGVTGRQRREPDPGSCVAAEARRVLADDGTCWPNLGDSYSAGGRSATGMHAYLGPHPTGHKVPGMRAENLPGLPWRVALREDGWILRHAFVWHQPSAMPGSVRDRLKCRHELVFPLARQFAYWFDLVELSPEFTSLAAARLSQAG